MNTMRRFSCLTALLALLIVLALVAGCSDRDPTELEVARGDTNPLVFSDDYWSENSVYWQPFFETNYAALEQDSVYAYNGFSHDGSRSLKFNIAPQGSAMGAYTGGVMTAFAARDLADYNALTFYARSNDNHTIGVVGYGNDNSGTSQFEAGRGNIPIGPEWQFFILPIPAPSKLVSEAGMFTFAEDLEAGFPDGYDIWIDEIRWAKLSNIETFRPSMDPVSQHYFIGSTVSITGTRTIFRVDGGFVPLDHSPNYFDYTSSDPSVAQVTNNSVVVVGEGQATVSATVENQADLTADPIDVLGTIVVTGYEEPTEAATPPTLPQSSVVSMFSDVYDDVLIDTWRADWGGVTTQVQDYAINGDNTKMYTNLNWVGVIFDTVYIDASAMSHYHVDVYAPLGDDFKLKFVSFPAALEGAGVESIELTFNADSTPAFTPGGWVSLDIPLADFTPADPDWDWGALGQMVISGTTKLVLVDNLYFHE